MDERFDCVVVGSGTSGGVIAYYLTAGGMRVLLLEAGDAYDAGTFPDNEMDGSARLFWNGGLELNTTAEMAFLRARCLGGGSVVNQCLLDRFDDRAWGTWTSVSGINFFTPEAMAPHYAEIESRLNLQEIPRSQHNRNARIFVEGCERCGYGWAPLRRGQRDCALEEGTDCIACLNGCPRDSKQSTLITFIRWAGRLGCAVRTGAQIESLQTSANEVRLYGTQQGTRVELRAPRVVLAGGALGNSHLLLRSGLGDALPALGNGFFCHPQLMTFAVFDDPVDAHKGAFQACRSDDARFKAAGFKLENVFAPPIATAMLYPGWGRRHHRFMLRYRHLACIEVAVRDETPGRLRVDGKGRLHIEKRLQPVDAQRGQAGLRAVREILTSAGAREIIPCLTSFGLHLMGGLPIGTDRARSVVTEGFHLHGLPRLYAADSSIFPAPPGLNPALTIMALSHRAASGILKEARS